jgi:hypothetical protein
MKRGWPFVRAQKSTLQNWNSIQLSYFCLLPENCTGAASVTGAGFSFSEKSRKITH